MTNKLIYLVRGLPGSGKSTFAKSLGLKHFEADMFFTHPITGEYEFNPRKISSAHDWCVENVELTMKGGESLVVSNTFTQEWEMKPYFELAEKYGYSIFSIIIENRHEGKNIHDCPEDKVEVMRNRFQIQL